MSRAWRKLNRKVQIDQRRYYLWMIAVLIGIPVNFIFSGWGEDELACTFAHFSSTWFMWVEYKTLSFSPPPCIPPFYQEHIHARTHTHGVVNYCLWVVSRARAVYVCMWGGKKLQCICMHVRDSPRVCVFVWIHALRDSSRAISGNDSRETGGECHYSDLFTF